MRISNEYIKNELGEMKRVSNDLNIPIEEIVRAFKSSVEVTLSNDIWGRLENTDSYDFKVGDWGALRDMAMRYKKTSPEELKKVMESGNYDRPLILKFGNRFHLVAGNTRLSTARVMGMSPKVFIGNIEMGKLGESKIKIGEIYNEVLDEDNNDKNKLISLRDKLASSAQEVYDDWEQDEDGHCDWLGYGGICQDIADAMASVLLENDIECSTVSAEVGEQHVWVIAQLEDGVYEVDISPYRYESGGGYCWKKKPNVKFDRDDIIINRLSADPEDYNNYIEQ